MISPLRSQRWSRRPEVEEPAGPGTPSLRAIQARLDEEIPHLYRDLALYLQVLREVLPNCVDQACSTLATQVHPRRYNRLHPSVREQLHSRLKALLASCCALLTVEQLLHLAAQMARERQRLELHQQSRLLHALDERMDVQPLPTGSIQLNFEPPLSGESFLFSTQSLLQSEAEEDPATAPPFSISDSESEDSLAPDESPSPPDLPWCTGQLPRDPVLLLHCLDGVNAALSRRLRNLSHAVNLELLRAGLVPGVVPVPLLDAVLAGQIESQAAPANLIRLPLAPSAEGGPPPPPMGVLLRTVDLELEQPRLRTCRRRLLHHRQEILKMAETSQRLQRRLQAHHAERLWRHDSKLNPSEGT